MWNECKGFIALMAITLLVACLIIIGMFIQKEASKELPRLKPREISMNVGVAAKAQPARRTNYGYAAHASRMKKQAYGKCASAVTITHGFASKAYYANIPTKGKAQKAKIYHLPKGALIIKSPEKKK